MHKSQRKYIKKTVINFIEQLLRKCFPLNIGPTGKYEDADIHYLFIEAAFEGTSVEDISLRHKEIDGDNYPSADDALYHLKNKFTVSTILSGFRKGNRMIIAEAKRHHLLKGKSLIALDRCKKEYYGKLRNENVVRGEYKNGTTFFFEFSNIDLVGSSPRLTLELVPHTMFVGDKDMPFLIESTRDIVDHEVCLFDRGIRSVPWFEYISARKPYLTPAVINKKMEKTIEEKYCNGEHVFQYEMKAGKKSISLTTCVYLNPMWDEREFLLRGKEYGVRKLLAFHTNLPYETYYLGRKKCFNFVMPSGRKLNPQELGEEYGKRWGIETDYRVDKREFLALTTSNNYVIRLFFFCLAILMRNCCELFMCLCKDFFTSFPGYFSTKLWKYAFVAGLYGSLAERSVWRELFGGRA